MRKFLIKIIFMLLPLLILAIPIEQLLRNIPNVYSYKDSYLYKHSKEIEILILGNSHAYLGVNPLYFAKSTFNAGNVSQPLDFDFEITNKFKDNFDKLKVIVVPISYFSLWYSLYNSEESWRVKNYVLYYGFKANELSDYSELLSSNLIVNKKRLKDYYIKHKNTVDCTELGWGTQYRFDLGTKNLDASGKQRASGHTYNIYSETKEKIFVQNIRTLNAFSDFCNKRNIKLIFLTTPTYATYRENINVEQLNKMVETINDFVDKHSNCYYVNWFEHPDFVAEDFFDADHLNERGAEKLSRKLSQQIDLLETLTDSISQ